MILTALVALSIVSAKGQNIHQDTASDMVYVDITPTLNKSYDTENVTTLWIGAEADHHTWLVCYWELRGKTGKLLDRGNFKLEGQDYAGWNGGDRSLFNLLAAYLKKEIE